MVLQINVPARVDATVQLGNLSESSATVGSLTFGQITLASAMRQLQVGLRFTF